MTILELAESFKTINWPDPTMTLFDGLGLGQYLKYETFRHNLGSSLEIVL